MFKEEREEERTEEIDRRGGRAYLGEGKGINTSHMIDGLTDACLTPNPFTQCGELPSITVSSLAFTISAVDIYLPSAKQKSLAGYYRSWRPSIFTPISSALY